MRRPGCWHVRWQKCLPSVTRFCLTTTEEGITWRVQAFGNRILIYLLKAVLILLPAVLTRGHALSKTSPLFLLSSFITDLLSVTTEPCKMRTRFQYAQVSVNTVLHKAGTPCYSFAYNASFPKIYHGTNSGIYMKSKKELGIHGILMG